MKHHRWPEPSLLPEQPSLPWVGLCGVIQPEDKSATLSLSFPKKTPHKTHNPLQAASTPTKVAGQRDSVPCLCALLRTLGFCVRRHLPQAACALPSVIPFYLCSRVLKSFTPLRGCSLFAFADCPAHRPAIFQLGLNRETVPSAARKAVH